MKIDNLFNIAYQSKRKTNSGQSASFKQELEQATAITKTSSTDVNNKHFHIMMPDENTLFNNSTGDYSYAPESTEENPIILVKRFDSQGNKTEIRINPDKVNPYSATETEMIALGVHTKKIDGLEDMATAMPLHRPTTGVDEKVNFIALFGKNIADQRTLGQILTADSLKSNMDFYMNYWANKNK